MLSENKIDRAWDKTKELIALSQSGNMLARERLVEENTPLVKSLVKRYLGRGIEYDDLFQVGVIGLMKAIAGFNPSFNARLSTYAVPMINGELKRFVRDSGIVKMPRSLKELQQKVWLARQRLCMSLNREPGACEIAEALKLPLEEIVPALESMNACVSLDEPLASDGESTLMETIEDTNGAPDVVDRMALRQCIEQLDERERRIILLRYVKNYTQSRVGEIMGISQVQISRIETRVIEKLRKKMGQ